EPEVPQSAVDQLRRGARRRAPEVAAVDQCHVETLGGRGGGDPRTDDPAADHEQVEAALAEFRQRAFSSHSAFVHAFLPWRSTTSTRPYGLPRGRSSRAPVIAPLPSEETISAS